MDSKSLVKTTKYSELVSFTTDVPVIGKKTYSVIFLISLIG
jgi:hypothetical protein